MIIHYYISKLSYISVIAFVIVSGFIIRYTLLDVTSDDKYVYQVPWYIFARDHGWAAIGEAFTNYTPIYSYLLIPLTLFGDLAEPWHLVKFISLPFELGCAVLGALLVTYAGGSRTAADIAFATIWLAPVQVFNGAGWAQTDSMWVCFLMLATCLACRQRAFLAVISFAIALSIKAQAVFWAPLLLGLILLRRLRWYWLAAVPATYVATCLPAWIAGRPITDLILIYGSQAATYRDLSRNAANIWAAISNDYYAIGCLIGAVMALTGGMALALAIARTPDFKARSIIFAAALTLLAMPFVLPKMHDRYFYGFEVMIMVLACIDRRFIVSAIIAQISGGMAYSIYAGDGLLITLLSASTLNAMNLCYLLLLSPEWIGPRLRIESLDASVSRYGEPPTPALSR